MWVSDDLPQLLGVLGSRATRALAAHEAFDRDETNRGFIDPETMTAHERVVFEELLARFGGGVRL